MTGWTEYLAAWAAFLLSHTLPVRPPVKTYLLSRIGRAGFGLAYSALSISALAWLISAAGRAPFVELWAWAPWQKWVTQAAMALACLVVALAAGRPNPFSFGGRHDGLFDPQRPGVIGLTRHPMLVALTLWSAGHLVANGDLAHVAMFGGFLVFALLGMAMIDRRKRRALGPEVWNRLQPHRTLRGAGQPLRWLAAVFLWWALARLHPLVIGPSVL